MKSYNIKNKLEYRSNSKYDLDINDFSKYTTLKFMQAIIDLKSNYTAWNAIKIKPYNNFCTYINTDIIIFESS